MRTIYLVLFLSILISGVSAKKYNDSNPKLSEELRKKMEIDVLSWDYTENPIIGFHIDSEGKVRNLDIIKKRDKFNASLCANTVIDAEPFSKEYRNEDVIFNCKTYPEISKQEFKEIKKYMRDYMKRVRLKVDANWFPDPKDIRLKSLISFSIMKNGDVSNIKILEGSNKKEYDDNAIRAIQVSSPFSPLDPKIFTFSKEKNKLNVVLDFNKYKEYQRRYNQSFGVGFGTGGPRFGYGLGYGGFRRGRSGFYRPWGYPYYW